jgi:nucleotide-binding universal stress UspA family protein
MRYLVATDGSAESDEAVRWAARHATGFGAGLDVVHVLTPETKLIDGQVVMPGEDAAIDEGDRILDRARDIAVETAEETDGTITVETALLTGRPAMAIADHAAEATIAAIYIGHRGLSSEREQVVGSVAKSVVDKATVPVMVIR